METRAAVAHKAGEPLSIETVQLEGPRTGEVMVEVKATGICHTDEFTLSGADPEGLFPAILGHEGAGVVVEVGDGVKSLKPGDHVIPLYTPECRECEYCLSGKTTLQPLPARSWKVRSCAGAVIHKLLNSGAWVRRQMPGIADRLQPCSLSPGPPSPQNAALAGLQRSFSTGNGLWPGLYCN